MALLLGIGALSSLTGFAADHGDGTKVLDPTGKHFGKTYSDLAIAWWEWGLNQPADKNPITDSTGEFCGQGQDQDFGQGKRIFFLAGNFGGETERTCEIPQGKALFFPLMNSIYLDEGTLEEMRAGANADIDMTTSLQCTIDGQPVEDLFAYRAQSPPGGDTFEALPDSLVIDLGIPVGEYLSVVDGYWLLVTLNQNQKHHVIEFSGVRGDPDDPVFALSVKYNLTLVGDKGDDRREARRRR